MADQLTHLTAVYIDPGTESEQILADLELDEENRLALASVDNEGLRAYLEEIVSAINGKEPLRVKVPGTEKFELTTRAYGRRDGDFLQGLKQYVRHYYSIDLRTDEEMQAAVSPQQELT